MRHVLFGSKKSGVTNFQTKRHQFPARIGSGRHTSNETLKSVNHDHIGHVIVSGCSQYDFGNSLIFTDFLTQNRNFLDHVTYQDRHIFTQIFYD